MPMSSIANPTRTEGARAGWPVARLCTLLATVLATVTIVSFHPFEPAGPQPDEGGDLVNQLGFGFLGAVALFGLFTLVDRRVATTLLSPWWLALLALMGLSVLQAPSPPDALRAGIYTMTGLFIMAAALTLPRDAAGFSTMLATMAVIVLGLCYYGVLALPEVAIHGAEGPEAQHAGLWRGSFAHKNIASPVMATLCFAGIYLWRRGWRFGGGLIFVLALVFMVNAGSKATMAVMPLVAIMVLLPGICGMRFLAPLLVALTLCLMGLVTLGVVFIGPLGDLHDAFLPDVTYTGRTTLWAFMGEMLAQRPWAGYGLEGFWNSDTVLLADQPFDRDWDIRGIVHGHNSYLDLAIAMGLPALAIAIVAFVVAPLRDFLRTPPLRENVLLADFFLMIAAFALINALFESFFFRRVDPVWLFLVFSLLGLRLTARFPVTGHV